MEGASESRPKRLKTSDEFVSLRKPLGSASASKNHSTPVKQPKNAVQTEKKKKVKPVIPGATRPIPFFERKPPPGSNTKRHYKAFADKQKTDRVRIELQNSSLRVSGDVQPLSALSGTFNLKDPVHFVIYAGTVRWKQFYLDARKAKIFRFDADKMGLRLTCTDSKPAPAEYVDSETVSGSCITCSPEPVGGDISNQEVRLTVSAKALRVQSWSTDDNEVSRSFNWKDVVIEFHTEWESQPVETGIMEVRKDSALFVMKFTTKRDFKRAKERITLLGERPELHPVEVDSAVDSAVDPVVDPVEVHSVEMDPAEKSSLNVRVSTPLEAPKSPSPDIVDLSDSEPKSTRKKKKNTNEPSEQDVELLAEAGYKPLSYRFWDGRAMRLDLNDIVRLNTHMYLNDAIIWFYLRLYNERLAQKNPRAAEKVLLLDTFFYYTMRTLSQRDSVPSYIIKLPFDMKPVVFLPVHDHSHWILAVIIGLDAAIKQNRDVAAPTMIILDSLGESRVREMTRKVALAVGRALTAQGHDAVSPHAYRLLKVDCPRQSNWTDCGVFLLHYAERILAEFDLFVERTTQASEKNIALGPGFWHTDDLEHKRKALKKELYHLAKSDLNQLDANDAVGDDSGIIEVVDKSPRKKTYHLAELLRKYGRDKRLAKVPQISDLDLNKSSPKLAD